MRRIFYRQAAKPESEDKTKLAPNIAVLYLIEEKLYHVLDTE
ncbi:hypothetical protein ORD22_06210 [Sporosarcina sp. GW1-11]|nr:hypothetical protein [Sporosarcina sp. GW1-11]MDV6377854.1 hypothetical protein [Sporosarcina sp. GW1-11]